MHSLLDKNEAAIISYITLTKFRRVIVKRKGKGKKILSIILCAILIMVNLLPVSVFGAAWW